MHMLAIICPSYSGHTFKRTQRETEREVEIEKRDLNRGHQINERGSKESERGDPIIAIDSYRSYLKSTEISEELWSHFHILKSFKLLLKTENGNIYLYIK